MDRASLVGQIRFQLARLKSLNKHHDFERLALAFARARVAANLIPATGPVSAGGDQQRDFESFRTSRGQGPLSETFAADASDDEIVGACTLEAAGSLVRKIKKDLKGIFSSEPKPTLVLYFCAENLAVAKQHALKSFCRETYRATLTIFDGEAISEHLADRDIFWIAVEYLDIPAESYPDQHVDEEYQRLREKWLVVKPGIQNYADFVEVKRGLRTSTFEDAVKADLTAWIGIMRGLIDDGYPPALEQKARYEICVGELRGHGSLDPALPLLERFFQLTEPGATPNELDDAAVLLVYASGACLIGQATISRDYILARRKRLLQLIADALEQATLDLDRCTLLQARAMLSATASLAGTKEDARSEMLRTWRALVEAAKDTPLYPVERLGPIMELMTSMHGSSREFRDLAADVDELIAERTGQHDAGDRARRRALIHIQNGDHLAAIDELQKVKTAYYSGEAIDGAVLAMLLLAEQYHQIGLHIAARYCAACALFISSKQEKAHRHVSKAAFSVVKSFYAAGEGLTSLYTIALALQTHDATAADGDDWSKHEHVQTGIYHAEVYRAITSRLAPELVPVVDRALDRWSLPPHEIATFKQFSDDMFKGLNNAEIQKRVQEQLGVSPFLDIGPRSSYQWAALGLRWTIEHGPMEEDRFAALEIVATLQILQADLADSDLLLVPTDVTLYVTRSDVPVPQMDPIPGNRGIALNVRMPASYDGVDIREAATHAMAVAAVALREASVMKSQMWDDLIQERMERGLPGRALFVRPPREMLLMVQPTLPGEVASMTLPEFSPPFHIARNPALEAPTSPGFGYSPEKARAMIAKRYKFGPPAIKLTLPRLLAEPRTRNLIANLRSSGWLDWQILLIVCNIVARWQVECVTGPPSSPEKLREIQRAMGKRMMREEREDDGTFDLDAFDEDAIFGQKATVIMLALEQQWGLENHLRTPDFDAIKALLSSRYGVFTDDVEHVDPFPGLPPT